MRERREIFGPCGPPINAGILLTPTLHLLLAPLMNAHGHGVCVCTRCVCVPHDHAERCLGRHEEGGLDSAFKRACDSVRSARLAVSLERLSQRCVAVRSYLHRGLDRLSVAVYSAPARERIRVPERPRATVTVCYHHRHRRDCMVTERVASHDVVRVHTPCQRSYRHPRTQFQRRVLCARGEKYSDRAVHR